MARRFARRRKPRVTWFPVYGQGLEEGATAGAAPGISGSLVISATNQVVYDAFPVTFDVSQDATYTQAEALVLPFTPTLQDLVSGNEWRLRRIVGKFFAAATADELDDPISASAICDVAAGFMVCNTDANGSPTTDFSEVNPLSQNSMEDPWIWRRRWLLNPFGNSRQINVVDNTISNPAFWMYPGTTAGYGSVADGPHIDQKTARVIHRDERLFFVVAMRGYGSFDGLVNDHRIDYLLDYRLLGSLRPGSSGNRRHASR